MRILAVLATLAFLPVAYGQNAPSTPGEIRMSAESIEAKVTVTLLRGNVTINMGTVVLRAEEADVDSTTGEVTLRGNVHAKQITNQAPKPAQAAPNVP